ncbi:MAG: prolipoprotein diacylglyceryl transferase [Anaerolineales bacterium]
MAEGFLIGPWLMRWHAFLLVLGLAAGALLAAFEAKRRGHDPEIVYYLFLPLMIWVTVGARLWHILTPPLSSVQLGLTTTYYLTHPLDALAFWVGGFGIPGAIVGGSLALLVFARRQGLPFWDLADLLAPGLALAQAIGRLGNYFNQELYGLPSRLPWAIFIQPANRLIGYESIEFYHPLFAYEMILNLANMVLILWLARKFARRLKPGYLFLVYLVIYSIIRFALEFLRLDTALVSGININQIFFAFLFVCAGIGLYLRYQATRKL